MTKVLYCVLHGDARRRGAAEVAQVTNRKNGTASLNGIRGEATRRIDEVIPTSEIRVGRKVWLPVQQVLLPTALRRDRDLPERTRQQRPEN